MPITLLDGILVGFTLVSAMLAMVRGFSREILSIASWAAAAICAFFFYKPVLPYVEPYVDNDQVALAASAGVVFLGALIVVTLITMKIADWIIDSRVGALDRTLGFLYGAARGVIVVAVGLLFFMWLVGANPPAWITQAKSLPLLTNIGLQIQSLLPDDPENSFLKRFSLGGDDAEEAPPASDAQSGSGGTAAPAGAPAATEEPAEEPVDEAPVDEAPADQ
jgi:membrane protein required for colicin V production